jgi:hypothetical protein
MYRGYRRSWYEGAKGADIRKLKGASMKVLKELI